MKPIRTILVATDFSEYSEAAVETAAKLASGLAAKLVIAHTYEVPVYGLAPYGFEVAVDLLESIQLQAARKLDEVVAGVVASGVEATSLASSDTPSEGIVAAARQVDADLIVMGTRGHTGLAHAFLGSVAERTLRTADCAVLIVRGKAAAEPRRMLAATDFSKHGDDAVRVALELAKSTGAELHIVHAFDIRVPFVTPYEVAIPDSLIADARHTAGELLDKEVARAAAAGVKAISHLSEVPAAKAISQIAEDVEIDLIVVGTHGHTGIKHTLLGSVAEKTVRLSPCSVLAVKSAELAGE